MQAGDEHVLRTTAATTRTDDPSRRHITLKGADVMMAAVDGKPIFGDLREARRKGLQHLLIKPGDDEKDRMAFLLLRFLFNEDRGFHGRMWEALGGDYGEAYDPDENQLVISLTESGAASAAA